MSARKGMNLKQVKYQLKSLEEAFERDATARHKNISVRNALIIAQECVDKQIGKKLESVSNGKEYYGHCCYLCEYTRGYKQFYCIRCGGLNLRSLKN